MEKMNRKQKINGRIKLNISINIFKVNGLNQDTY